MLIKKKSVIVALVSTMVICLVLVVNLAGYLLYLELKDDEMGNEYRVALQKMNARVYSKHIEIARLGASFERTGLLSGRAVLEGIVRNDGYKDITDLLIKVKFLDKDGAAIYDVTFHPQEPSLGSYEIFAQTSISHLTDPGAVEGAIKPENSLPFKKILVKCPDDILSELKAGAGASGAGGKGGWSGKFGYEILSVNF